VTADHRRVLEHRALLRTQPANEHAHRQDAEGAGKHAEEAEGPDLRRQQEVKALRGRDENRIARRMRLVRGDVEVADSEREIDRIEIFERWR